MKPPDLVKIVMAPMAMLTSEALPNWFQRQFPQSSQGFMKRGLAGNLLLLTWAVNGMLIAFMFMSTLRANMLIVELDKPIDTLQQLAQSDQQVYLGKGTFERSHLKSKNNQWSEKILETSKFYSMSKRSEMIFKIGREGGAVPMLVVDLYGRI